MKPRHLHRFYGYLSRDLALYVWNDLAIPTGTADRQNETKRNRTEQNDGLTLTSQEPQRGSGASRKVRSCHSYRNCKSSERSEVEQNKTKQNKTMDLHRLHRNLSGDLAFDVWDDLAIPVEFPDG